MCQLSEDARQRLSHLQLGPHYFRKETESQPPFLVSRCDSASGMRTPSSSLHNGSMHRCSFSSSADQTDSSLLGSYRSRTNRVKPGSNKVQSSLESQSRHGAWTRGPTIGSARAQSDSIGPLNLSNHSLRERLQTSPSHWEEIHSRVQRILQTHRTTLDHRVTFDP
ncbi:hypothetical protein INR49_019602 [Caranx melampygus]|nr:hypothetical protein INR49_019602 [Caranx melampygus]